MSRYFPDELLTSYIKMKERRKQPVSPSELVYFLLFQTDLTFANGEATRVVEDFLARRHQGGELIDVIEQIRRKKEDVEREALIASLRQLARRHKRRRRLRLFVSSLAYWVIIVYPILWLKFSPVGMVLFYIFASSFAENLVDRWTRRRRDIEDAKTLACYSGVHGVGLMAEALTIRDVERYAAESLIRELPKLKANDALQLNEEKRGYLYAALKRKNRPLILAILKALEQVGDEKAIPYVERLAAVGGRLNHYEIRKAAKACLPYLRERAAKQKEHQTLLRPSSAAEAVSSAQETLLRPVQCSDGTTEPQELLRATIGE